MDLLEQNEIKVLQEKEKQNVRYLSLLLIDVVDKQANRKATKSTREKYIDINDGIKKQ